MYICIYVLFCILTILHYRLNHAIYVHEFSRYHYLMTASSFFALNLFYKFIEYFYPLNKIFSPQSKIHDKKRVTLARSLRSVDNNAVEGGTFSEELKQFIVDLHNELRQTVRPPAVDMLPMVMTLFSQNMM